MNFKDEIKQNYIKQHNSFGVRCRETPENCMISAQDKAGVTPVAAKLYEREKVSSFKYSK